jgi:hypothetical protein
MRRAKESTYSHGKISPNLGGKFTPLSASHIPEI